VNEESNPNSVNSDLEKNINNAEEQNLPTNNKVSPVNDTAVSDVVIPAVETSTTVKIRRKVWNAIKALSIFEKIIFGIAVLIAIITGRSLINQAFNKISTEIPASGGTLIEATTDYSRFINPILARSETDRDLTTLIYSGIMKIGSDGNLQNDLASSVAESSDGTTYTVTLRDNLQFHDRVPLTADDVVFTIQKIKDPNIKSPLAGNWSGVDVKKIDDKTIEFDLPKPYEPFLENLTVGILPAHLWASTSVDSFDISPLNRKPIGSGPYKIDSTSEQEPGVVSEYKLIPFDNYAGQKPYITSYIFDMYKDEDSAVRAMLDNKADAISGISIDTLEKNQANLLKNRTIYTPMLPRTYSLFFNQSNSPVLLNPEVRQALNQAIDKTDLIKQVRNGYGVVTDSPIPGKMMDFASTTATTTDNVTLATNILLSNGWKKGTDGIFTKDVTINKKTSTERLSFNISTSNSPELKAVAQYVANVWKNIGAEVNVQIYESSDLSEQVIIPRKYDILLFGQIVGRDSDLYPFWHSSQQKDLGLNLAMYANKKVDTLLESLRATSTESVRASAINSISSEINKDLPAIFLYSPDYLFVMPNSVRGIVLPAIDSSSERLYQVSNWYIDTRRILNAFQKN
jgi:peptide/nickel transport system substrate-binding protein